MRKLEKVLGLSIIISLFLKFQLIPYSGILLTLSLMTLALIYYPLGFAFFNEVRLRSVFKKESYKGITALRIIGAIGIGIGLSILCIGILFKLQHWGYSDINLMFGLIVTFIALIIVLIRLLKVKDNFYTKILKRIMIMGGLGLILLFTPELSIIKIQFRNHPDYITMYEAYLKNPDNEEIQTKLDIEFNKATMSEREFEKYIRNRNEK